MYRVICLALLAVGCSSVPRGPEYSASEVIERIGDLEETPKWTIGDIPVVEENGNLLYAYSLVLAGDARIDTCLSIAEVKTKANILDYIKVGLTSSGQVVENVNSSDPSYDGLIAFLSAGKLSGVKTVARYWEKRVESDANGNRVLKLKCAARISIAKTEIERQLREAVANKGNAEVRAKLVKAQEDFIEKLGKEEE